MTEAHPPDDRAARAWLERALTAVVLSILAARLLLSEAFESAQFSFLDPWVERLGPTPATTAWLDLLLLAASTLALAARRAAAVPRVAAWAVGLLASAVVISTANADNQHLAALAGGNLVAGALAGLALTSLLRDRRITCLLLALLLAGGAANAVKCGLQVAYEFDDTLNLWREQTGQAGNAAPGAGEAGSEAQSAPAAALETPEQVNFERRLMSREAFGLLSHPNITAACLAMCLLVAGGALLGASSARLTELVLLGALLTAPLSAALLLTRSRGGILAAVAGLSCLIALGLLRNRVRPRPVAALLLAGSAALIAAGAGLGISRGTLPDESLSFRWEYWTAAVRALPEKPITGLGRLNFADAYLRHKSSAATEEVRDPHNLWVSLLAELGPLGLLAGALLVGLALVAATNAALRPTPSLKDKPRSAAGASSWEPGAVASPTPASTRDGTARKPPPEANRGFAALVTAVAIGTLLIHLVFSRADRDSAATLLLWAVSVAGVWCLGLAAALHLLEPLSAAERGRSWIAAGLAAALLAAALHALVDFAPLTPAGLSLIAALSAAAVSPGAAARSGSGEGLSARLAPGVLGRIGRGGLLAIPIAHAVLITWPTVRSETAQVELSRAAASGAGIGPAVDRIIRADPWDPVGPRRAASELLGTAASLNDDRGRAALRLLEESERRDPRSFATQRLLAQVWTARSDPRAAMPPDPADRQRAAGYWEQAVALYPTEPRTRIGAGRFFLERWRESRDPGDADRALAHFRAAEAIDALRSPDVAVKLNRVERAAMEAGLRELLAR
jgi:hypothetical protein